MDHYVQCSASKIDCYCIDYTVLLQTFATELKTSIRSSLIGVINQKCNCNFTNDMIASSEFGCVKSSSITYRSTQNQLYVSVQ